MKLEALLRRLPIDHPKRDRITDDLSRRMAGYRGEQGLDYPLSFLPEDQYHIFHDLRMYDGSHFFQVDTLILSQRLILIVEVKNIKGTLKFDSNFNQLIRIQDGKEEPFPDPILQVERHSYQLRKWLNHMKYPQIPIEPLIVIGTPRTILQTTPNNQQIYDMVLHSAKLPFKIKSFDEIYKHNVLNRKKYLQLSASILYNHCSLEVDILQQYDISVEEIVKGVHCPKCFHLPMTKSRNKWMCPSCSFVDKTAYIDTLKDYRLLVHSTITNQKVRGFLNISSSLVANRLLHSMNLPKEGSNKGRVYHIDL